MDGLAPMDDVISFGQALDCKADIMYVGHLPFMEKLTGSLTAGDEELTVLKFQNGGIVCLDQTPEGIWFIKWALMPQIG